MRTAEDYTLQNVRKSLKPTVRVSRPSDFLTSEEKQKLRESNAKGKKNLKKFDDIDAYAAEILARFGYDAYMAWNAGTIPAEQMQKYVLAERSRDTSAMMALYGVIMSMVGACVKKEKGAPAPKGPKVAQRIFREELKKARGEF